MKEKIYNNNLKTKTVKKEVYDIIMDLYGRNRTINEICEILKLPEEAILYLYEKRDNLRTKTKRKEKEEILNFSHIQTGILVGTILGDAHIKRSKHQPT